MFSLSIRSILAISLIAAFLSAVPVFAEGFIGEDLGTDMYRKVDAGYGTIRKTLIEKRIPGSMRRMNDIVKRSCKGIDSDILSGSDFTVDELEAIQNGVVDSVAKKIKPEIALSTDLLMGCAVPAVQKDYARVKKETKKEIDTLSKLGSI